MSAQVAVVAQLKAHGEAALRASAASIATGKSAWVAIRGEQLPWRFLAGKLTGSIDSGDLELRDRTGAVSVSVDVSGADDGSWRAPRGADVTIRVDTQFSLLVEAADAVEVAGASPTIVFAVRVPLSSFVAVESVDSEDEEPTSANGNSHHKSGLQEIFLMVTHIASVTRATTRWGGAARPQLRHIHGVAFAAPSDASAARLIEKAHCAEVLVGADCASAWYVKKHGLYRVRVTRIRSESDRSGGFQVLSPADDHAVRAVQEVWKQQHASDSGQCKSRITADASCVLAIVDEVERTLSEVPGDQGARRKLRVYRVDKRGSFVPVAFQPPTSPDTPDHSEACCREHEACRQAFGATVPLSQLDHSPSQLELRSCLPAAEVVQRVCMQTVRYITALLTVVRRRDAKTRRQVSTFLVHGIADTETIHFPAANLHQPRLLSLIGLVCERRYYWRESPQFVGAVAKLDAPVVGEKRQREEVPSPSIADDSSSDQGRRLMCVIRARDLSSLDTVDIHVDTAKFGFRASLQRGDVVDLSKLQGFIARSTFRAYLNWSYLTSARVLRVAGPSLPSEAELYGSLPTSFLTHLYCVDSIGAFDRRVYRYVVRVVYVNYVILKRKCRSCHRALVHDRRRGWTHSAPPGGDAPSLHHTRRCEWYQLQHTDAALARHSYVHTNVRCIVDDGSAQAELFLENDVAWELLRCSPAQRSRLMDVRVSELRFFAGQSPTAGGFFSSAWASDDALYYENQLREVVLGAVAQLRQLAVFARRFYSKASESGRKAQRQDGAARGSGPTSILTFGRDVQVVTRTRAPAKLDARRVDDLHVKSELRQLLARLRVGGEPC